MFNPVFGLSSYFLPTSKRIFIFFLILSIIALILPSNSHLFFLLFIIHIFVLTQYADSNYSEIYLFCQRRRGFYAENTRILFFFCFYFMNAFIFVIATLVFIGYVHNSFTMPFIMQNLLDKWFGVICLWMSGVSYISVFGLLDKVSHQNNSDLPEET